MTGAPMPAGAEAVVPIEQTTRQGDRVTVREFHAGSRFIARQGADIRAGETILHRGTEIGSAQVAALASVGAGEVAVFERPRVAVLSTGDELVAVDQTPGPGQIRDSNGPMLVALLENLDCEVNNLGRVADKPELIRAMLERGLSHDALFVTGGMSMGRYDYVPQLLAEMKVELKITKLKIKPGKPFVFGVGPSGSSFVFGLPGNPVSAYVCVLRLAARLLRRLAGGKAEAVLLPAELAEALPGNGPREFYQPVKLQEGKALPLPWKGSGDVFTLATADGLMIRRENEAAIAAGARVKVLPLPR